MDDQSVSQNPGYLEKDVSISFSGDKIRFFFFCLFVFLSCGKTSIRFHGKSDQNRP